MEKGSTISFDTIEDLNHFFKSDTKNHLVSVIDFTSQPTVLVGIDVIPGFYSIFLRYPKNFDKLSQEMKEGIGAPTVTVIPPGKRVRRRKDPEGIEFNNLVLHAVRLGRVAVSD